VLAQAERAVVEDFLEILTVVSPILTTVELPVSMLAVFLHKYQKRCN
jgi:hypothetical protein